MFSFRVFDEENCEENYRRKKVDFEISFFGKALSFFDCSVSHSNNAMFVVLMKNFTLNHCSVQVNSVMFIYVSIVSMVVRMQSKNPNDQSLAVHSSNFRFFFKIFSSTAQYTLTFRMLAWKEVCAQAVLKHPNILQYYSAWAEDDHMYIQSEFCNG